MSKKNQSTSRKRGVILSVQGRQRLFATATSEEGIYSNHLCYLLWKLKEYPELATAMKRVVRHPSPSEIEPLEAFKLKSMGLVKISNQQVRPSCGLYRQYFRRILTIP